MPVKPQLLNAAGTSLSAAGPFTFLTLPDRGPGYQLNVKTTGYPAGTYTLLFTAGSDPAIRTATFVIS